MRNKILRFCLYTFIILNVFLFSATNVSAESKKEEVVITVEQISDKDTEHTYMFQPTDSTMLADSFTWTMKGNDSYELVIPVSKEGTYRYRVTSELKDNSFEISVTGLMNDHNSLDTVTVVRNSNGDKVSKISFEYPTDHKTVKNSSVYTGDRSSVTGYAAVFTLSISVLCGLLLLRNRNEKGDEGK